jgi:hypothetical protein
VLQATEEDVNFDGKPDVITVVVRVASNAPVHSVKALLQFKYAFTVSMACWCRT